MTALNHSKLPAFAPGVSTMDLLNAARADFYERAGPSPAFLGYVREQGLDVMRIGGFAGSCGVLPISDCGAGRFDFADVGQDAFICEAFGEDGETVVDLVAWPLNRPRHVMTMFGVCGMVGLWEAFGSEAFYFGDALTMHRCPLDWLKAGCSGAAIVTPRIAARQFLDIPGPIAARDHEHGRELLAIAQSLIVPAEKIVVSRKWRAAA